MNRQSIFGKIMGDCYETINKVLGRAKNDHRIISRLLILEVILALNGISLFVVGKRESVLMRHLLAGFVDITLNEQMHGFGGLDADQRKCPEHEGGIADNLKHVGFRLGFFDTICESPLVQYSLKF